MSTVAYLVIPSTDRTCDAPRDEVACARTASSSGLSRFLPVFSIVLVVVVCRASRERGRLHDLQIYLSIPLSLERCDNLSRTSRLYSYHPSQELNSLMNLTAGISGPRYAMAE